MRLLNRQLDALVNQWVASGHSSLTPEQALAILQHPIMLAAHDLKIIKLVKLLRFSPDPQYAAMLRREIHMRKLAAQVLPDPFLENLPSCKKLPQLQRGRIPLVKLQTGGTLSLEVGLRGTAKNLLAIGPTGSGKTNFLKVLLTAASGQAIIVVFDRKGDLADIAAFQQDGDVVVCDAKELQLALFQPVPGMGIDDFISLMTEVLARNLNLIASRRLISDCLTIMFQRRGEGQSKVALSQLIDVVEKIRANSLSRLGQYREAVLYALKDLLRRSSRILDYTESNLLEEVFSECRTFIINCGNIPLDHLSLIVSLFYMFVFETRRISRVGHPPVLIVVDDALPLVTGSTAGETEGGTNPISTWSFMGRSFNIGLVVGAQNFSLISPALRNNTDTLICFGSSGEDAQAVVRHMNLNTEQADALTRLQIGEAVVLARSEWPLAVRGWVPEVR